MHKGESVRGSWFRANQGEGYTFTDGDGDSLPIPVGRVYLGIVPEGTTVSFGS
jgi:hypothetical protein